MRVVKTSFASKSVFSPGIPVPVPVGCLELMQAFILVGGGGGAASASTAPHSACGGEEEDSRP